MEDWLLYLGPWCTLIGRHYWWLRQYLGVKSKNVFVFQLSWDWRMKVFTYSSLIMTFWCRRNGSCSKLRLRTSSSCSLSHLSFLDFAISVCSLTNSNMLVLVLEIDPALRLIGPAVRFWISRRGDQFHRSRFPIFCGSDTMGPSILMNWWRWISRF